MENEDLSKIYLSLGAIKDLLVSNMLEQKRISDKLDSLISLSAKLVSKTKDNNHELKYMSTKSFNILKAINDNYKCDKEVKETKGVNDNEE